MTRMEMLVCYFEAVEGFEPDPALCEEIHPYGCEGCSYYLPELPGPENPEDINAVDELPFT